MKLSFSLKSKEAKLEADVEKLIEKEKKQRERITSKIFDVLKIFFIPIILGLFFSSFISTIASSYVFG